MADLSKLAVLIDADNTQPAIAEALLAEIAKYGVASVKRIYGDWTQPNLKSWKEILTRHAIQPMQQFSNTTGKNATDSAMIIDAMDLLYSQRMQGFCLVTSDSDFTRLASRIREAGLTVYGFGERKTPQSLVAACDRFIYLDLLRDSADSVSEPQAPDVRAPGVGANTPAVESLATKSEEKSDLQNSRRADGMDKLQLSAAIRQALEDAAGDDGWASLGGVGSLILKRMPSFDPRTFGHKKLSDLVAALNLFEVEQRGADGKNKAIYLRERVTKKRQK